MMISLPQQKVKSLKQRARHLSRVSQLSVREIAQIIGLMISVQPVILPASLFYWNIERLKIQAPREQRSYDAKITLTEGTCTGGQVRWRSRMDVTYRSYSGTWC